MSRPRRFADQVLSAALLQIASGLVPREQQAEWRAEWRGELWQVVHTDNADWRAWQGAVFTSGAFKDAYLLRTGGDRDKAFQFPRRGSALRCLFLLFAVGFTGFLICITSPDARMALAPPANDIMHSVLISADHGYRGIEVPSIRVADYRRWTKDTQRLYSALAFYRPIAKSVAAGKHSLKHITVAVASRSMVEFLNLTPSVRAAIDRSGTSQPQLLLTPNLRHALFDSASVTSGQSVQLGDQRVMVAGVVSRGAWPLPAGVAAWLIEPPQVLNRMSAGSRGFVVARVDPNGSAASLGNWWYMFVPEPEGGISKFTCIAISGIIHSPLLILLEMLCLALAALPATTPLDFGEYPHRPDRHTAFSSIPRWIFFILKIGLIVPAVYFWSVAVAYYANPLGSSAAVYIQMVLAFLFFLFAFRWAWRDQRLRCPVCLQLLTNPAQVGRASHSFLDWSGMEWICSRGHGFLHIPELPTSWLSIQCWLYLNPSWQSLFSDACME
ncbi:MAG: hypothetical protein M1568_02890 [Acidobacteria bacterium]|jgi:hypothetical protein|nr:hypothetical protein [Acidobacteriota bacterium]